MIFAKIVRGMKIIFSHMYWMSQKKRLNRCGENAYIEYPFISKGEKYISIGDDFYANQRLQIEAIDKHNQISFTPAIIIGNNVSMNYDVHIGACNKIVIEDGVLIASKVFITDHFHGNTTEESMKIPPSERKLYSKGGVHIGKDTWVGEGVVILPGVEIGANCIIGANSVVTHSFEDFSIIGGNPAKVIRKVR